MVEKNIIIKLFALWQNSDNYGMDNYKISRTYLSSQLICELLGISRQSFYRYKNKLCEKGYYGINEYG